MEGWGTSKVLFYSVFLEKRRFITVVTNMTSEEYPVP